MNVFVAHHSAPVNLVDARAGLAIAGLTGLRCVEQNSHPDVSKFAAVAKCGHAAHVCLGGRCN
eukprot:COSAG02_NODE_132_length_34701_cov_707.955234_20_plen_63_part_00